MSERRLARVLDATLNRGLPHAAIRAHVAPLVEDRPMQDDVEAVCRLIADGTLVGTVETRRHDA